MCGRLSSHPHLSIQLCACVIPNLDVTGLRTKEVGKSRISFLLSLTTETLSRDHPANPTQPNRVRKHAVVDRVMKQVAPVRKWEKQLITVGKMQLMRWCPGDGSAVIERTQVAAPKAAATAATAVYTRKGTRSTRLAEAEFLDSTATSPERSPAISAQPTPEVSPKASPDAATAAD